MTCLCKDTELMMGSGLLNSFVSNHVLTLGCRVELGKKMIADALAHLPVESRDEVVAHVIEAVFAMRAAGVSEPVSGVSPEADEPICRPPIEQMGLIPTSLTISGLLPSEFTLGGPINAISPGMSIPIIEGYVPWSFGLNLPYSP